MPGLVGKFGSADRVELVIGLVRNDPAGLEDFGHGHIGEAARYKNRDGVYGAALKEQLPQFIAVRVNPRPNVLEAAPL